MKPIDSPTAVWKNRDQVCFVLFFHRTSRAIYAQSVEESNLEFVWGQLRLHVFKYNYNYNHLGQLQLQIQLPLHSVNYNYILITF